MWEVVSTSPDLKRLKVPGGWIVLSGSSQLLFVADAQYAWALGTPVPTPTPVPTTTKWIGTNLFGVTDWSTDYPFRNLMFSSRTPISGIRYGAWSDTRTLTKDARGNVLSLASDQVARLIVFTGQRPVVDYLVSWTGTGVLEFPGFTVVSSPTTTSRVIKPNAMTGNAWIELISTDVANPLRELTMVRLDQKDLTGLFNPIFLNEIKRYACIRFMDWQNTNTLRVPATLSSDLVLMSAIPVTFTGGSVPLEVMIQLCNEANTNAWFCIPINADAAYIDRFLQTIKAKLNPALKAHIELSNEVWNTIFPQYTAVGGATHDERMLNYAVKSSDLAIKTKQVLGTQGVSIFGAQAADIWWMNNSLQYLKTNNKPLPEYIATAPYFGGPDDLLAFTDGRMDTEIARAIDLTKQAVTLAASLQMKGVLCYEAGQHIGVPGATGGTTVNRDPRIGNAYRTYLRGMRDALGKNLLCHFTFVSPYGNYGSWGEKEYLYSADSAKSVAIKDVMAEG